MWLLILSSLLLISCQGNKQAGGGGQPPVVATNEHTGGTDSTGGGNGLKGRPLDSYIERNIEAKPYYTNYVLPLMKTLATSYPRLAADFYHITHQRDWYFMPTELEEISRNILGTYGKTDQLALQDLNKIWIDSNKFDAMSEQDQATLVIHEIMMGVRLMKFKHKQDQCIAKSALAIFSESPTKSYNDLKKACRKTYPMITGIQKEKFDLNSNDYDLIRKLVSLLDRENPDVEEVKDLIETSNYRNYND